MTYRYSEEELADIQKRQAVNLANFERNSGRGLPEATVRGMERADGIKRDEHGAPVPKRVRASKYRNVPMEADGIKFASILEARFFQELELRRQAGEILYFLRQVPFHLPGGVIYRIDFAEVMRHPNFQFGDLLPKREGALDLTDETPVVIKYIDCKGFDTQAGKNKIKQVEALYGVRVHLVRKVRRLRSK